MRRVSVVLECRNPAEWPWSAACQAIGRASPLPRIVHSWISGPLSNELKPPLHVNAVAHASKLASLSDAAALIADGSSVAFGGSLLHRAPSAITRELARQGRRDLTFIKPSAAYDIDLLAAAGCLSTVYAGIVSMEVLGQAPNYRRAVEEGRITLKEHT